jgi:hypothetical protein
MNFKDLVYINGIMEIFIMENGMKEKCMDLVNFIGEVDIFIEVNTKMI